MDEQDIIFRLRKRAEIRRQITTRKSVQENKPDRIAELLDEAALEIETLRGTANKGDHVDVKIMLEKFAELIVKECAGTVEDAVTHREPASTYVNKIKDHFGVK